MLVVYNVVEIVELDSSEDISQGGASSWKTKPTQTVQQRLQEIIAREAAETEKLVAEQDEKFEKELNAKNDMEAVDADIDGTGGISIEQKFREDALELTILLENGKIKGGVLLTMNRNDIRDVLFVHGNLPNLEKDRKGQELKKIMRNIGFHPRKWKNPNKKSKVKVYHFIGDFESYSMFFPALDSFKEKMWFDLGFQGENLSLLKEGDGLENIENNLKEFIPSYDDQKTRMFCLTTQKYLT